MRMKAVAAAVDLDPEETHQTRRSRLVPWAAMQEGPQLSATKMVVVTSMAIITIEETAPMTHVARARTVVAIDMIVVDVA